MYYSEQWIDGRLYFKTTPNGKWKEVSNKTLVERRIQLEDRINKRALVTLLRAFKIGLVDIDYIINYILDIFIVKKKNFNLYYFLMGVLASVLVLFCLVLMGISFR